MITVQKQSAWMPRYIASSILDIDSRTLQATHITTLVFDLDNTLVPWRADSLSTEYIRYIQALKKAGFTILIGSNTRRDISSIAAKLEVAAVVPKGVSYKPFASFYARVTAAAQVNPVHIAMAGDHIVHDVIGANRAGHTSILVQALHGKPSWLQRLYVRYALGLQQSG